MSEKSGAPAIRFKGFTDPWEQRKLGELCTRITAGHDGMGQPTVEYEDINPGEGMLNKDLSAKEGGKPGIQFEPGDVLYGKLRPYLMNWLHPQFRGVAVGDFWVLRASGCDGSFLFRLIQSKPFQLLASVSSGSKMPRADWSLCSCAGLHAPALLDEQRSIGSLFSRLDSLITLRQREHDRLIAVKKALLEKMFPKEGETVPAIRFKGFTDPWEQRKLGEIVTQRDYPVPTPANGYVRLGVRSHARGVFHEKVEAGEQLETAQMHMVHRDNLIVNITFAWEHAVAITGEDDENLLVSHRFPQFSFDEGMRPDFFGYAIADDRFRHHLWLSSPGGAGRNRVLKIPEMLEYGLRIPDEPEQRSIGSLFSRLDSLITLRQRELDTLKNVKKSLLEKMFV